MGKRTVVKENKGINVEKIQQVFLKIKIIKEKRKKNGRRKKNRGGKKKENSTELQKSNLDAEVYSSNKKCE